MVKKCIKLLVFCCCSLLFVVTVQAQTQIQNTPPMRQVLGATGGSYTFAPGGPIGSIDYTVGELMVTTDSTSVPNFSVHWLTQGFLQPENMLSVLPPINEGELKIYSGITANGDGHNDSWIIDGITIPSQVSVSIYNRWGDNIYEAEHYDNVNTVWKGEKHTGQALPDGTYFYIIKEPGKKAHKGWVELTH
jgi:gliding motility-associated-like protein